MYAISSPDSFLSERDSFYTQPAFSLDQDELNSLSDPMVIYNLSFLPAQIKVFYLSQWKNLLSNYLTTVLEKIRLSLFRTYMILLSK